MTAPRCEPSHAAPWRCAHCGTRIADPGRPPACAAPPAADPRDRDAATAAAITTATANALRTRLALQDHAHADLVDAARAVVKASAASADEVAAMSRLLRALDRLDATAAAMRDGNMLQLRRPPPPPPPPEPRIWHTGFGCAFAGPLSDFTAWAREPWWRRALGRTAWDRDQAAHRAGGYTPRRAAGSNGQPIPPGAE